MYASCRARRADERAGRGRASRARVRHLPRRAPRTATRARDDDPAGLSSCSPSSCPGTPRSITVTAGPTSLRSSSARTSLGTPRAWRRDTARAAVLSAGCVQRFVPMVALSFRRGRDVVGGTPAYSASRWSDPGAVAALRVRTLLWLWILGDRCRSFRSRRRNRISTFFPSCPRSRRSAVC